MIVLYAGLVVWIITMVCVESELFRPVRECCPKRFKLDYLTSCALCTGVWVGWAVAGVLALLGAHGPLPGVLLNGLLYKGAAHWMLILQRLAEAKSK